MDEDDPIRIDTEGITVTKRYEPDDFAVPTISFEIRSTRKQPGRIRLEERVPDEFPIKGIGFHPDYDSERWTAHAEGRLVFESRIEPETTLITVYGIRIEDDEEAAKFMSEPELTVQGIESAGSAHSGSMEIVADGAGDAIPVPVSHVTTVGTESTTTETAGVGATLAAELRAGTLSDADRTTLADALFESESESERVQLTHLQSRVSELEAYTEAFESFLDDNGTGEQLVAELQDGLKELRGEVGSIDSSIDEALTKQTEGIDALESDLDAMEATLGDHDDLAADIDAVSDDLDAIYEEVDELRTWREQLGVAFGSE
jgi:hypothetical protein